MNKVEPYESVSDVKGFAFFQQLLNTITTNSMTKIWVFG